MNEREIGVVCAWVVGNWPREEMSTATLDVYRMEIGPLDFDATMRALREDFAEDSFAPTPMQLRARVLRRPEVAWESLVDELLSKVASVGYARPEPGWSHPAIGEFVHQRGGWVTVCQSTPGRDALGPQGVSVFNTWQAQARDHLRPLIVRAEREATHTALGATAPREIDQ